MPKTIQPVIQGGTIDGFEGLTEGEKYKIIPFGLVKRGVITQDYADWLFDNEPLTDGVVVVVAVEGKQIIKYRAAFDVEFDEPVHAANDITDAVAALEPRHHPNWLPD